MEHCAVLILFKSYRSRGIFIIIYCGYPGNPVIVSVIIDPGLCGCGHIPYRGNGDSTEGPTGGEQLIHKTFRYIFTIQDAVVVIHILFYILKGFSAVFFIIGSAFAVSTVINIV